MRFVDSDRNTGKRDCALAPGLMISRERLGLTGRISAGKLPDTLLHQSKIVEISAHSVAIEIVGPEAQVCPPF